MPGLANVAEANFLDHLFVNAAWANIGDATGLPAAATAGNFYISLHTADPGETGDQTTNEATYTGYARVAVPRSSAGWTRSGTAPTQVANAALITFAACTGGSNTITHFAVGRAGGAAAGEILFFGALSASLAVSNGITPQFAIGALQCSID